MTSYIENNVRACKWTCGRVVMSWSSSHSLGHVLEVMGLNRQLEKNFFFSISPPDIRHEPAPTLLMTTISLLFTGKLLDQVSVRTLRLSDSSIEKY